ncbi:MAG: polyhydroxyalkanoate synthesis repressor PhaR [Blastocatellia bacterium]|nr:polyhydroxyalkanoate synthesis repressor PhaR [Blastocatellia bacterium]
MPKKSSETDPLLIKRYGNRRLYNTETGAYVNFDDLIALIRSGRDIRVIDSTTKEDLTKIILTQIILEEEKNNRNILPVPFLYQLIRYQEATIQDFFQNYLAATFDAYLRTKQEFDRKFRDWLNVGVPMAKMFEPAQSEEPEPPPRSRGRKKKSDSTESS